MTCSYDLLWEHMMDKIKVRRGCTVRVATLLPNHASQRPDKYIKGVHDVEVLSDKDGVVHRK